MPDSQQMAFLSTAWGLMTATEDDCFCLQADHSIPLRKKLSIKVFLITIILFLLADIRKLNAASL
jgi:hypothetical protein